MNTGIQDAYNLGWKLALVVKGEAEEALVDSYEEERLPVAQQPAENHRPRLQVGGLRWLVCRIAADANPRADRRICNEHHANSKVCVQYHFADRHKLPGEFIVANRR